MCLIGAIWLRRIGARWLRPVGARDSLHWSSRLGARWPVALRRRPFEVADKSVQAGKQSLDQCSCAGKIGDCDISFFLGTQECVLHFVQRPTRDPQKPGKLRVRICAETLCDVATHRIDGIVGLFSEPAMLLELPSSRQFQNLATQFVRQLPDDQFREMTGRTHGIRSEHTLCRSFINKLQERYSVSARRVRTKSRE